MALNGGRCRFGVDLKSFMIFVEKVKGKVVGKVWERGRCFSSWIRFGEQGLALLLGGVE